MVAVTNLFPWSAKCRISRISQSDTAGRIKALRFPVIGTCSEIKGPKARGGFTISHSIAVEHVWIIRSDKFPSRMDEKRGLVGGDFSPSPSFCPVLQSCTVGNVLPPSWPCKTAVSQSYFLEEQYVRAIRGSIAVTVLENERTDRESLCYPAPTPNYRRRAGGLVSNVQQTWKLLLPFQKAFLTFYFFAKISGSVVCLRALYWGN